MAVQKDRGPPTGNFVIAHKTWCDIEDDEINLPVNKTLEGINKLFTPGEEAEY